MLVPKKNGKVRLVIDYRQLNRKTIKSRWPIPSIEEMFHTLEGSPCFTSIDMSAGFYQVPLEEKSLKKIILPLLPRLDRLNGLSCPWD